MLNSFIDSVSTLLMLITETGQILLLGLTPVMLVICVMLAVSNIWLMRNEGRRPVNTLGILFAIVWFVGRVLTLGADDLIMLWDISYPKTIWLILIYVIAYFECMFLSTVACTYLATKYTPALDRDYIIILGCGIRDDGTLTPILRGRADAAIKFERAQYAATKKHAKFVPSGGQGADEVISESEAMKRYLIEQGYPAGQIVMEDKSVNTDQNIRFSRDRIKDDAGTLDNVKAGFATTNYHIFRGYILSKKHGLDAQGISAKTKWYFYPNAFLREFVGLLFDKKRFVILSVALMLTMYSIGEYLLSISAY